MKILIKRLLLLILTGISCNKADTRFSEIKDKHLTLQVMKVQEGEDRSMLEYRVRLLVNPNIDVNKQLGQKMWYHTDSCFYFAEGERRIFPMVQEPVANGIKNSFEYLLLFNSHDLPEDRKLELTYRDLYISDKTYSFDLNKN